MTFAKGASLKDPSRLFNASLEGNTRRAIDFREGGNIADSDEFAHLFRLDVARGSDFKSPGGLGSSGTLIS